MKCGIDINVMLTYFLLNTGIYEMFCRELFGKKPKTLEFGLQPHQIPDSDTVRHYFRIFTICCMFLVKINIWQLSNLLPSVGL